MEDYSLKIITNTEDTINQIYIDNNSNLTYFDDSRNQNIILNLNTIDHPIFISEFFQRLNNRRWNLPIRKCIKDDNELYYLKSNNKFLENLDKDDSIDFEKFIYKDTKNYWDKLNPCEITEDLISDFMEKYYNILKKDKISFFNASKIEIDLLNKSVSFNMINPGEYTNTINLLNLKPEINNTEISSKVDLTIEYSMNNYIYNHNITFPAFIYNKESDSNELISNNLISHLGKVDIEYINGIINVIPNSEEVDECIISNCIISYGNI